MLHTISRIYSREKLVQRWTHIYRNKTTFHVAIASIQHFLSRECADQVDLFTIIASAFT